MKVEATIKNKKFNYYVVLAPHKVNFKKVCTENGLNPLDLNLEMWDIGGDYYPTWADFKWSHRVIAGLIESAVGDTNNIVKVIQQEA